MSSYNRNPTWQDSPSTATLVTAATLNRIEDGLATHTHVAADVTDLNSAIGTKADVATLNSAFGSTGGVPIKPWLPANVIDRDLWVTSNFDGSLPGSQTASTNMTITGDGTEHLVRTMARYIAPTGLPPYDNGAWFRIEFDYDATAITTGWFRITLAVKDPGDALIGDKQIVVSQGSPTINRAEHFIHDFAVQDIVNARYIEVELHLWNNVPSGTMTVTNPSLRRVAGFTPPMLFMSRDSTGTDQVGVHRMMMDVPTGKLYSCIESIGAAGSPSDYYNDIVGYDSALPWGNAQTWADPLMLQTCPGAPNGSPAAGINGIAGTVTSTPMRVSNNDQIIIAKNGAGNFEFRGNAHGGEVTTAGRSWKVDKGDGVWVDMTSRVGGDGLLPARRVQWNWPSSITSSDQSGSPFASVSHLFTLFPDGITRCDRTTTFNRSTEIGDYYEWMSSYNTANQPRIGRIGRGLTVIGAVDSFAKVAIPAAPTVTTATTGGTLAAATYSYRVAALSTDGETIPSPAGTVTTTGATSTATPAWSAVSGATGYRVYGRTAGTWRLLATVASTATSYIDTGAAVPVGLPQSYNNARILGQYQNDFEMSDVATWAVWFDPISGWAHGNIYDRESILSRSVINGSYVNIQKGAGIQKQYNMLTWAGPAGSFIVPSGTAWSATHWSFIYRPENPDRYHNEIAVRAASLSSLKSLYPTT